MSETRLLSFRGIRHIRELKYPWFDDTDKLEDGVAA